MIGEGEGRVTQARRFHSKLPLTLEDLDGTRREGSLGQATRNSQTVFGFGHQGAEQLGAKG